jgi:hypothetical protein
MRKGFHGMNTLYAFVLLTGLFSTVAYVLYFHASRAGTGTYMDYLMWCPGLACLHCASGDRPIPELDWVGLSNVERCASVCCCSTRISCAFVRTDLDSWVGRLSELAIYRQDVKSALSLYNTGDSGMGFRNNVYAHANRSTPLLGH